MNYSTYMPDPKKWVEFFRPKKSSFSEMQKQTCMELTSPVQSVVDRAKSELERINKRGTAKPVITDRSAGERKIKLKRLYTKKASKTIKITPRLSVEKENTVPAKKTITSSRNTPRKTEKFKEIDDVFG